MNKPIPKKLFYCIILALLSNYYGYTQNIDFGKSYVNITKGLNGGTVEPGDTLEIRAVFVVRSGFYDSCGFFDIIPTGTAFIPGTIRVLTNEGKIYKQFTDVPNDDEGWISGSNIRINMGYNQTDAPARSFRRGRLRNTHKPNFGNAVIQIASFRVRVTAALGSIINTGGGSMTYKLGSASLSTFTFPLNRLSVYTNIGMCPNLVGANSIGTEFNGTFGSGKPRNRAASANVPAGYTYQIFNTGSPNDYFYGVANNTSTRVNYTTSNTWPKPDNTSPTHRVFSVWDIIGDHTGAVSPTLGNPASDTVANNNGGYMLVVNAAYRIDSAFQQTISGLCPNTYYEISCWVRNICSKCGTDSNGTNATNTSALPVPYIPTAAGAPGLADSSGVTPNLTFEVDGLDYYTTGNIRYTGQWIKKGFTFRTGPSQTSFVLKFFNNAPGGGGNDWALDDISVATCYPNLTVNPTPYYTACAGNVVDFGATVRSFFNNYNQYKWQRSTNNGVSWNDMGVSGTGVPALIGGQYEYSVSYPTFIATAADSGHRYRIVVATTIPNLSNINCSSASSAEFTTLNIINCTILPVQLISWTGTVVKNQAKLRWVTEKEDAPVSYTVERSENGTNYLPAGTVEGKYQEGTENAYYFDDPVELRQPTFYRLTINGQDGRPSYSHVILLQPYATDYDVQVMQNPFKDIIRVNLQVPEKGDVLMRLMDMSGRVLQTREATLEKGAQSVEWKGFERYANGLYMLEVSYRNQRQIIRLMKEK
jgi:trimeric autotransporter adhesin